MEISIDTELKRAAPNLVLGVVYGTVQVVKHAPQLWEEIEKRIEELQTTVSLESIDSIPSIQALRNAYKALGKDPSRYRGSQEALLRRILQGKGLYKINNIVDINNLISLESLHSVGSYDVEKLESPIVFRVGKPEEFYKGIGKGIINVANLPVFADALGPFGSPTSDSEKAMITLTTSKVMTVIMSFSGSSGLHAHLQRLKSLWRDYAGASDEQLEIAIIE